MNQKPPTPPIENPTTSQKNINQPEPQKSIESKNLSRVPFLLHINFRDKIIFVKYLSVMLVAGIPLREALDAIRDQIESKSFHHVLDRAITDLANGLPLGTSLAKFPKLFDPFFINIITVGESSGTLPAALEYLNTQLEKSHDLINKVRSALLYPGIVFAGALGVGSYLAFVLLPQLVPMFQSLNIKLPITTRLLLFITSWCVKNWLWVIIGLVVIIIGLILLWRIRAIKFQIYRFILIIPIFGQLTKQIQITQFARILGTLLTSGVKIVPALHITANSVDNLVYQKELEDIATLVEQGGTIGSQLSKHRFLFPSSAASIVAIGERTGRLSESLISLATFNDREIDDITQNLSTLIEPLVLVLVGITVGFVALSVITPIYQLTQGLTQ